MAEQKRARGRASKGNGEGSEGGDAGRLAEEPQERLEGASEDSQQGSQGSLASELKSAMREAAGEVLSPVARNATSTAAKYAISQGPKLLKDKVMPAVEEAGGLGPLAQKAGGGAQGLVSKLPIPGGGDSGGGPSGTGRGRRLPIQESVDVAVPIETAYNQFTQFEDFPEFMHRAERVEQKDDTHLMWHENIWGVRRQWEAEITDQTPNERIAWQATSGSPQQKGVVTFHRLSDRLTRIEVTLDQQPKGVFEKTSSGFRMTRRALRSDLMRFKAFIETRDEETGAWRGEVEEGEVVGGEEESPEPEEEERPARPRRRRREAEAEEPEAEAEGPDEEEYSEEDEAEYAEPEEEEKPRRKPARRRQTTRRRSPAGRSGRR